MLKRLHNRDERGFSVIELTVASFLGLIVMASLLALLQRGSKSEVVLQQVASSQQGAREGIAQVMSDLRGAQPLEVPPSGTTFRNAFQFSHTDLNTGTKTEAVWQLDASGALVRTALNPITHLSLGTTYRMVDVNSISFHWFNKNGEDIGTDPAYVQQCAVRVTVQLVGQAVGSSHPVQVQADTDLRNINPNTWCDRAP